MLTLLYAAYRPIAPDDEACVPERIRINRLAALAAKEFMTARCHVPDIVDAESYLCSTVLNGSSMDPWYADPVLTREIERRTGCAAPSGVLAYECASWAYALRRLQSSRKAVKVLVFVADWDTKGFSFWRTDRIWGHSGFGLSTLVFEHAPHPEPCVWTGASVADNTVLDFAKAVKRLAANFPDDRVSMPYFRPAQFQSIERLCTGVALAPNLHAAYGHCFGSDPWVGLLRACLDDPTQRAKNWICASIALSGYYGMARLSVHPSADLHLTDPCAISRRRSLAGQRLDTEREPT